MSDGLKKETERLLRLASAAMPGPWRYQEGGGHASNSIRGSDSVQVGGWPERRNDCSNASYSDRVCENLGDVALSGPFANVQLITSIPGIMQHVRTLQSEIDRLRDTLAQVQAAVESD